MFSYTSRVALPALALLLPLAALAACADEPLTSAQATAAPMMRAEMDPFTVTSTIDDGTPGTLRWSVKQATGGETIRFASALAGATIRLDSTLVILTQMTIDGPPAGITLDAQGKDRVINLRVLDTTVTTPTVLRNMTLTGGKVLEGLGGAISVGSAIRIEHSTITGNEARSIAAIWGWGYPNKAHVTLVNSTVTGNVSSAISWPAIDVGGDLTLINSTVAGNSSGGISGSDFQKTTLRNSIVANNGSAANCHDTIGFVYEGRNVSSDASCGPADVITIADPKLDVQRANGGPTPTMALLPGSPAIDAGGPCGVTVDQRYRTRDGRCDLGAYEEPNPTTAVITVSQTAVLEGAGMRVSGTIQCSRADAFAVRVQVQQQKTDNAPGVVRGSGEAPVSCTTTATPWSAMVVPSANAFRVGAAAVIASTHAPDWVSPATVVQSVAVRKAGK